MKHRVDWMRPYRALEEVKEDCPSCDKATYTREGMEEYVEITRLHLYNSGLPCGPKAMRKYLEEIDQVSQPLPSERTIGRILAKRCLTHGRTGYYEGDYR